MDHDAMHKDVAKLKGFRERVEKIIPFVEGLMAAGGKVPGVAGAALSDEERGRIIDGVVQQLGGRLSDLDGRVKGLEIAPAPGALDMSSFDERLNKLETAAPVAAAAVDQELADRTESMLTWFEANREGLELLLSLDGDPDVGVQGTDTTGTANAGAGVASGEGSGGAGTNDPGAPAASQDAPADADKPADKPE
jgi:hypothetical protein